MLLKVYSDVCKACEFALEHVLNHRLEAMENTGKEFQAEDSRINPWLCRKLLVSKCSSCKQTNKQNLSPHNPVLSATGTLLPSTGFVTGSAWVSKLKAVPIPSKNVSAAGFVVQPTLHRRIWSHVRSLTLALLITQTHVVFPTWRSTENHISRT